MPSWFIEGMAMKFSKEFSLVHKIEISKAIWNKTLIPLDGLNNFHTKNKFQIKLVYAQAASAMIALEYYYGVDVSHKIISFLKNGQDFWDALYNITGDDKIVFQEKYEDYINDYFIWIFLLNASNLVFILFPFILILGYLIKRYNNKKILKKWELEEQLIKQNESELLNE